MLVATGRPADAIAEAKAARELDPFSSHDAMLSGMVLFMTGQYDKAIEEEGRRWNLIHNGIGRAIGGGYAYEQKGM